MEMRPIDADALKDNFPNARADIFENCRNCSCLDNEQINQIIDSAPTIGGWISVKERLPERYERILTYDKYSGVKENWLLRSYPGVSWSYGFHVTHWMPLPEPPKEVNNG